VEERKQQGSIMRRIHEDAKEIIFRVGHGHENYLSETHAVDQSQILSLICRLANEYRPTVRLSTRDADFQGPDSGAVDTLPGNGVPPEHSPGWLGIADFFNLEWFWRVWLSRPWAQLKNSICLPTILLNIGHSGSGLCQYCGSTMGTV